MIITPEKKTTTTLEDEAVEPVVYAKWKRQLEHSQKTQTQPTTTHTHTKWRRFLTKKLFLLLRLRKRKGEKKEVECCWMERGQGENDSRVQLTCTDTRDLVLQRTESVLHVLKQLRVIGFNLCLAFLHRVLREKESNVINIYFIILILHNSLFMTNIARKILSWYLKICSFQNSQVKKKFHDM